MPKKLIEDIIGLGSVSIGGAVLSDTITRAGGNAQGINNLTNLALPLGGTLAGAQFMLRGVSKLAKVGQRKGERNPFYF